MARDHYLQTAYIFEEKTNESAPSKGTLYDPEVYENIEGIVFLHYTGDMQFIPNLFSPKKIDDFFKLFPIAFDLFDLNSDSEQPNQNEE